MGTSSKAMDPRKRGWPRVSRWWIVGVVILLGLGAAAGVVARWGRPAEAPELLIRRVRESMAAQDWKQAESLVDRLVAAGTRGSTVEYLRAQVEAARGQPDAAVAALRRIQDGERLAPSARLLEGQIERKRDQASRAESALLSAVRLNPALSQARRELAFLYGIQGRRHDMDAQFRELAKLVPLDMNGMFLWSNCHEEIIHNIANKPVLERFIAADPADRWSRLALAEILLQAGSLEECETLLTVLPAEDAEALALRIRLKLKQSQLGALPALLALGPTEHPILARLRGQFALRRHDQRTAARQFEIAVRLDPSDREALQGLSVALNTLGDRSKIPELRERGQKLRALSDLLQVHFQNLEQGGRDPTLARRLGAACEALGRLDMARSWYRVALGVDPQDAQAREGFDRLARLAPL